MVDLVIPGLRFPEGPRWHDGAWWLSDQLGAVHRLGADGAHTVVAELFRPSGLGFTPDGDLLVVTMDEPAIIRITDTGPEVVVDLTPHAHHCNDMYVDTVGRAYVNAYDEGYRRGRLLLVAVDGSVTVAADDLAFPNGVAVTPDGSTLVVAETFRSRVTAFDVAEDGTLSNRRTWADLPGAQPDGLCLDAAGGAWVASYLSGEALHVTPDGGVDEVITVGGRWVMACALGGDDGRTLLLCTAETDTEGWQRGEAVGFLETHRVAVLGVGRP